MKLINCGRCKIPLGELAKDTRILKGVVHLCSRCGKLVIAEAFKRDLRGHGSSIFEQDFGRG